MTIGDLVRINDEAKDSRGKGVILKFDTYNPRTFEGSPEPIVEVLWSNNTIGWILQKRLDILAYACKTPVYMV